MEREKELGEGYKIEFRVVSIKMVVSSYTLIGLENEEEFIQVRTPRNLTGEWERMRGVAGSYNRDGYERFKVRVQQRQRRQTKKKVDEEGVC